MRKCCNRGSMTLSASRQWYVRVVLAGMHIIIDAGIGLHCFFLAVTSPFFRKFEAAGLDVPLGPLQALAQGQEPRGPGRAAREAEEDWRR
jgi:hypothetical protein